MSTRPKVQILLENIVAGRRPADSLHRRQSSYIYLSHIYFLMNVVIVINVMMTIVLVSFQTGSALTQGRGINSSSRSTNPGKRSVIELFWDSNALNTSVWSNRKLPFLRVFLVFRSRQELLAQPAGLCHVHSDGPGWAELQARTEDSLPPTSGRSGSGGGCSHSAWIPGTCLLTWLRLLLLYHRVIVCNRSVHQVWTEA